MLGLPLLGLILMAFGLFVVTGLAQILQEHRHKPGAGFVHHRDLWYWLRLHKVDLLI